MATTTFSGLHNGEAAEAERFSVTTSGLSSEEAANKLLQYGRNELPEKKTPAWVMFLSQFTGSMPFMLEACIVVSMIVAIAGETSAWEDFGIIFAMVVVNACIGFYEESKAQASLDGLKGSLATKVPCIRDGKPVSLDIAELVPGDIISLRGGDAVPADCEWVEGDTIKVDTASLTGEPIPWNVPRPDKPGEPDSGKKMLSGFVVVQGECFCRVEFTGPNTEIGKAAASILDNSGAQQGFFESKIMGVVNLVIFITLCLAGAIFAYQLLKRGKPWQKSLLSILSLIIGAVPIALPLVIQVTMAIGAGTMAKHKAIITHLTALQEIASMTVLNSDKTGTLTTAKMSIIKDRIFCLDGYDKEQLLLFAALSSNAANLDDPIDRAIFEAARAGVPDFDKKASEYTKERFFGFNAIVKRAVGVFRHPGHGQIKICKGLIDKVLKTGDDEGEGGTWVVADEGRVRPLVKQQDMTMSEAGYKTIGIAVSIDGRPMEFAGIVPMLDPPRHDTKLTISRIRKAGIDVKMITGDHLNIAKETAALIDLGVRILPSTALWPASDTRDQTIMTSDGFAQVLPKDKQEIVLVEQKFGLVVGMTGDGVNDAAALSQAQVGIAVDGATDAAKNASDIILTEPGLSAIYTAIVESRKIFQRLKAYVLYRLGATIQIVVVLVILSFAEDRQIPPLFVVLLALLNDISLTPISADNATPSPTPDVPTLGSLLWHSMVLGGLLSGQTLLFWYFGADYFGVDFHAEPEWCPDYQTFECCHKNNIKYCTPGNFKYLNEDFIYPDAGLPYAGTGACDSSKIPSSLSGSGCGHFYQETLTYIQISLAVEFLIFSTRTVGPWFLSRPSNGLIAGVMGANILVSVLAVLPVLWNGNDANTYIKDKTNYPNGSVAWSDLGYIWLYDLIWLFIIDGIKMLSFWALGEFTDGELDEGGDVLPEDAAVLSMEDSSNVRGSEMSGRAIVDVRASMNRTSAFGRASAMNRGSEFIGRGSMARASTSARDQGRIRTVRASMGNSLRPKAPSVVANLLNH